MEAGADQELGIAVEIDQRIRARVALHQLDTRGEVFAALCRGQCLLQVVEHQLGDALVILDIGRAQHVRYHQQALDAQTLAGFQQ